MTASGYLRDGFEHASDVRMAVYPVDRTVLVADDLLPDLGRDIRVEHLTYGVVTPGVEASPWCNLRRS